MKARRKIAFALVAAATAFSLLSAAQTKKGGRPPPVQKRALKADPEDIKDGGAITAKEEKSQPSSPSSKDAGAAVVEQKTADGGAKVFRFGEVEVEGRLKSPQIVYFLRRVRAEFAAGDLGHRSFMRELSETRNEPGF